MFNAKLVWQQNITEAKVELSRNQHTLRQVEERIRRRDAAKTSASTTSGRGPAAEVPVNTSPSYRAALVEAHAAPGKATDDTPVSVFADHLRKLINTSSDTPATSAAGDNTAEATPVLPTKEKRKVCFTGFDVGDDDLDDGFSALQEEEQRQFF